MSTRLTPLGVFGKWVIVPLLLALAGYFVLSPVLAKRVSPLMGSQKGATQQPSSTAPAETDEAKPTESPMPGHLKPKGPDVDVEVDRDQAVATKPRRTRRKRAPKADQVLSPSKDTSPSPKAPEPDGGTPDPDPAGSGGATTGGGTTADSTSHDAQLA